MIKQEIKSWALCYRGNTYASEVPCSYYHTLVAHGLMEHPYLRDNEKLFAAKWGDSCIFEATLTVSANILAKRVQELVFEGLDTLCTVYLNDMPLGKTDNMHRTWRFSVKGLLLEGANTLRVEIDSAVSYFKEKNRRHPLKGNGDTIPGFAHIRKAFYMSGWDWGPTLPDMGIWRPVYLLGYDAKIEDVELRQRHHADGSVTLTCKAEINGGAGLRTETVVTDEAGREYRGVTRYGTEEILIEQPALWWPNGYGAQPLYTVTVRLLSDDTELERVTHQVGLRTLTVSQQRDRWGKEFCFLVNGIKIFAMGANYIPEENLLPQRSREKTERLIRRCVEANFNIIRVWGGGIYPDDWFYELCDKYGIIVWQDFMFGCNMVWLTDALEETIKAECVDNLRRIRHHACLGLLCGNNENEEFLVAYMKSSAMEQEKADYLRLFCRILPEICERLAPDIFYWSSSPSSGTPFFNHADDNVGDRHIWTIWSGLKPIDDYKTYFTRFCSEFGFESLPDLKTVEGFTLPADRNLFSPVMERHQKHKNGNGKLMYYIAQYYDYPTDFGKLIYATQLMQERAIRTAVEHFRRHRGRCMGAVYWQLNDCWPVASWASIDYEGRAKALYWGTKRFFAPVLLSADVGEREITLNISSEQRTPFTGTVSWCLKDTCLNTLWEKRAAVTVSPLSAKDVVTIPCEALPKASLQNAFLEYTLYDAAGSPISRRTALLVRPKAFHYPAANLQFAVTPAGEGKFTLTVKSNAFARKIMLSFGEIEAAVSDQYFDITEKAPVTLTVTVADPTVTAENLSRAITYLTEADLAYSNAQ